MTGDEPMWLRDYEARLSAARGRACGPERCGTCTEGYALAGRWGYCAKRIRRDFDGGDPCREDVLAWMTRNALDLEDPDECCEEWEGVYAQG